MKPEDKVATQVQSQKLIELGFKIETEKYWQPTRVGYFLGASDIIALGVKSIPAPDVAELGEILPDEIWNSDKSKCLWTFESLGKLETNYGHWLLHGKYYKTEAQARCAALIWLIENKHIEIK